MKAKWFDGRAAVYRNAPKLAAGWLALVGVGAFAQGTDPISTVLASIDLTTVGAAVAAITLLIVAIAMTFKGGQVGKRAVRMV